LHNSIILVMYAMGEMNKSYITKVLQLDVHI